MIKEKARNYFPILLSLDFKSFLIKAFSTIAPGEKLLDNWHIDLLIACLQEIERENILRLVINIPPRSLKSSIISVCWPAWLLGHRPHYKIIVATHSREISFKLAGQTRLIMGSAWYKEIFPNTSILSGYDTKAKFITNKQGFRLATSVGSQITGEGADILIMDDPQTPSQANSPKLRKKVNEWFANTFASRLNNKKRGVILLVSQRLHTKDLSDFLLSKSALWQQVKIPAQAEIDYNYQIGSFSYSYKEGCVMLPAREGIAELERIKLELGASAFNSQYQQNPANDQSSLIKSSWLQYYDKLPAEVAGYVQSWDCGVKVGVRNDYSVCTTWLIYEDCYYLVDLLRVRLEYPDLKETVVANYRRYNCIAVLIEDKASGQALLQDIKKMPINAIPILPKENKTDRLLRVVGFFAAKKVLFPQNSSWLTLLIDELLSFPNSLHDDQVDSISQFLNWFEGSSFIPPRLKVL
jgi:predicted phage terminase large subunit-like protein